jgi:hypothetical protein
MTISTSRTQRRLLRKENSKLSKKFVLVPSEHWPQPHPDSLKAVWRSAQFLVQIYIEGVDAMRLSICRTQLNGETGRWYDEITWDEMQGIKRGIGYGEFLAVEIFPADKDIVNVANMRHLWVLDTDQLPKGVGWIR